MATRYIYHGGDGSTPTVFAAGLAGAHPTLDAAIAAGAAGDTFLFAHDCVDNYTAAKTFAVPGTTSNPTIVGCVNRTSGARTTGGIVQTTGNFGIFMQGNFIWDGVHMKTGLSATGVAHFTIATSNNRQLYYNMTFTCTNFSASRFIVNRSGARVAFDNVGIDCPHGNTAISLGYVIWRNSTCFPSGLPNNMINNISDTDVIFEACDLSSLSGKTLRLGASTLTIRITLINCKLPASFTYGTMVTPADQTRIINCSVGTAGKVLNEYHDLWGSVQLTDAVYRSGGAGDEASSYSVKLTGNSSTVRSFPLRTMPLSFNVLAADVGVSKTATIYLIADSAATFAANEAWGEVEYLGASDSLDTTRVTSGPPDVQTNGTAPAADTSTWTGGTTPTKYKIALVFTPLKAGMHFARFNLAKNATAYVDPKVVLT